LTQELIGAGTIKSCPVCHNKFEQKSHIKTYCSIPCKLISKSRRYHIGLKISILTHYGNGKLVCVQCGEKRLPCLSIDHVNNDGYTQKDLKGSHLYRKLRVLNYPLGFQTLCMNCQFIKKHDSQQRRV
jgi:hypothetical protein